MKLWLWLGLSIASGIAYSVAGKGGFRHAKLVRRLGCSLLALGLFLGLKGSFNGDHLLPFPHSSHWWAYLLFIPLNYLALSTYWDGLTRLWRGNEDEYWENWILTGTFYSLASFPLLWSGASLIGFVIRTIVLGFGIMLLRENTGSATIEEVGSGFLYALSIPLLLI